MFVNNEACPLASRPLQAQKFAMAIRARVQLAAAAGTKRLSCQHITSIRSEGQSKGKADS
jgi:hypothetical protein